MPKANAKRPTIRQQFGAIPFRLSPGLWAGILLVTSRDTARWVIPKGCSPLHMVDVFRTFYGPVHKAFIALDLAGQDALEADLLVTIARFDTARDGSARISSDYAEIVIISN